MPSGLSDGITVSSGKPDQAQERSEREPQSNLDSNALKLEGLQTAERSVSLNFTMNQHRPAPQQGG